jgi:hypothetical protein
MTDQELPTTVVPAPGKSKMLSVHMAARRSVSAKETIKDRA